jgi:hypothetical protein
MSEACALCYKESSMALGDAVCMRGGMEGAECSWRHPYR